MPDELDGTHYATRDWVKFMIEHSVTAPLARIEAQLNAMQTADKRNDISAREAVRTRTDYIAPLAAALGAWILMLVSKKLGLL
jgi:hypothetical protein